MVSWGQIIIFFFFYSFFPFSGAPGFCLFGRLRIVHTNTNPVGDHGWEQQLVVGARASQAGRATQEGKKNSLVCHVSLC